MIRKLKRKVILLTMGALLILLTVLIAAMNLINYHSVVIEADNTLSFLSQTSTHIPPIGNDPSGGRIPPHLSPELPFESRYFTVILGTDGSVIKVNVDKIASVDEAAAQTYAAMALTKRANNGFIGRFRFAKTAGENSVRIVFLDCTRQLDAFDRFLTISLIIASCGFAVALIVIWILAGRITRPIAESYEKQKRFITDAGHEMKTPLTIINANTELLEMELGDNECLTDIRSQSQRLASLTNDLVLLSRMEEAEQSLPMIPFPLSEAVADTVQEFEALAHTQGKEFVCRVQPLLSLNGNDQSIRRLVTLLLDNALKYSPYGGTIICELKQSNRGIHLHVFNTTETDVDPQTLPFVFDRFYRTDPSRNSETGGYGIGLSVAKAIVTAHGGKICATTNDRRSFQISILFPH